MRKNANSTTQPNKTKTRDTGWKNKRKMVLPPIVFKLAILPLLLTAYSPLIQAEEESCRKDITAPGGESTCVNREANDGGQAQKSNPGLQGAAMKLEDEEEGIEAWLYDIDWGEPQLLGSGEEEAEKILNATFDYMTKEVLVKGEFRFIRNKCLNKDERCTAWAFMGV